MNDLLDEFIMLSQKQNIELFEQREPVLSNHIRQKKINELFEKILFQPNGLQLIQDILEQVPDLAGGIAIALRGYEPDISKTIYKKWYLDDPMEHFQGRYVLSSWEEDQKAIEDEDMGKIQAYKNLKEKS